jgi:hypothetical protein
MKRTTIATLAIALLLLGTAHAEIQQIDIGIFGMD